jgi:hypothetical protein
LGFGSTETTVASGQRSLNSVVEKPALAPVFRRKKKKVRKCKKKESCDVFFPVEG